MLLVEKLKFTISLFSLFVLGLSASAQEVFDNAGGQGDGFWTTGSNWVGGNPPLNADNVRIEANVTYDVSQTYTQLHPTVYGDISTANGVVITIGSNSDLCFNGEFNNLSNNDPTTIAGQGQLIRYKPAAYITAGNLDFQGKHRVYDPVSVQIGTDYYESIHIKDGGVFYLELPSGSTPMEFDDEIIIESGGAIYVENHNATINIGRSAGAQGHITVKAGGTLGALTPQTVTVNFNDPLSTLIFESGANFVENGSAWTFSGTASPLPKPEFQFNNAYGQPIHTQKLMK